MGKSTQFLRFGDEGQEPLIRGESFDVHHRREIDLVSWHWGVKDPTVPTSTKAKGTDAKKGDTKGNANQASARGPQPDTLSFTKFTDRATAQLLQAMDGGRVFPKVVLIIEERFPGTDPTFHLKIWLKDAFLVGCNWSAQAEGAGTTFSEEWTLNYSEVHFEFDAHYEEKVGKEVKVRNKTISQLFTRPPEASGEAGQKSPLTAGEKQDAQQDKEKAMFERLLEYQKKHPQKAK